MTSGSDSRTTWRVGASSPGTAPRGLPDEPPRGFRDADAEERRAVFEESWTRGGVLFAKRSRGSPSTR